MKVAQSPTPSPPRPPAAAACPGVTTQIFIGLALGIVDRLRLAAASAQDIKPLADAFLRMIKMIIAPLLFSTLVVGIAGTGDLKAMGRIGLKAIIYFEVATTIALFWGLALVNWFQPGRGRRRADRRATPATSPRSRTKQQHAWDIFLHLFPTSVVDAMAQRRHPAAGRLLDVLRHRASRRSASRGRPRRRRAREHGAGDVQVHRLRDDASRRSA